MSDLAVLDEQTEYENVPELAENSLAVLKRRYLRKGRDGEPVETVSEMFHRVARHVASAQFTYGGDVDEATQRYYDLLTEIRFLPNSPTFTGAGTPLGQLAACFVLPISDDMGRDSSGIFQTLRDAALIQQTGGGNGFSFSKLRPKGAMVNTSAGQATGPVGFLRVYDQAFGEIAQGGTRRGANMAVLNVSHPDIREFVTCKTSENHITNFNISVGLTDEFMHAVENDRNYELVNPQDGEVWETVRARDLFNLIVTQAHHNGEPGILFIDAANRSNPVPNLYELEATNPCGEQWLGPYESCCLGSVNLAKHLAPDHKVNWERLRETVETATRFLDDVITANAYVPAVPQLQEAAFNARRIGLGIMGLADLMYHVGVRYGSKQAQEFASQVMEFVRYHCMLTSVDLALERGSFPAIEGSIYGSSTFSWTPPEGLAPYNSSYQRPAIDWELLSDRIKKHGIRNAAQTTVAPTGTIATVAGCEGYGCEPVFALAYVRHVNDNGKDLELQYTSPLFERALSEVAIEGKDRQNIIDHVTEYGSCQSVEGLPDKVKNVFVVAADITPEEHVRMQASIQCFVDNSISKTCNFPSGATREDVAKAYKLAWELGCKGLTVYVTGSREKVVLETNATKNSREDAKQASLWNESKKPRAGILRGETHRVMTPLGHTYVTINENGHYHPFEVFIQTSKAGSDTAAVSEAIGRLISYILRLSSQVPPSERMKEVIIQLGGIGGGRPLGFGPSRVLSLPDGVAQALSEYLSQAKESEPSSNGQVPQQLSPMLFGDLCPECGEASVVNEEGCRKCYSCSFSEC